MLKQLTPDFREQVELLLAACAACGVVMAPFFAHRDCRQQARLWRQSRSFQQIEEAAQWLADEDADYLARCLLAVGPQYGRRVTDALPGLSWHQHRVAVDCYWLVDGRAEWSTDLLIDGQNGYRVYVREAEKLGLTTGKSYYDFVHVQSPQRHNVLNVYTLKAVDELMREEGK